MHVIPAWMNRPWFEKIIIGALRSTIEAHGPISKQWLGSAAKRVSHQLFGELKKASDGDVTGFLERIAELESEIQKLRT